MGFQFFPSFSFNEANVGPRPVRSVTRERVGMVGVFTYAPNGAAVANPNTALKLFGSDASVGSVHMQAILDQGVGDILVSPVFPAARVASLATTLTGVPSASGSIIIHVDPGNSGTILTQTVAVTSSETDATLAAAIVVATNAMTGVAVAATQPDPTTGGLLFTANTPGAAGNAVQVRLEQTGATGLTISAATLALTPLAGGINAPTAATLTLSDVSTTHLITLTALPMGTIGNGITSRVVANLDPTRFDLYLDHAALNIHESYKGVDPTDVYDLDKLTALRSSLLANGQVLPTFVNTMPAAVTQSFTSGTNGDTLLTTTDYQNAIDAMANIQCTVICAPGIKVNTVSQAALDARLIAQAEGGDGLMGEIVGLRIAVTSVPRSSVGANTYVADFAALRTANRIIASIRGVCVTGWGTSTSVTKYKRFGVDPSAPYAGHLVMTPNHISPAARTSSPTIKGINETDTPTSVPALNEITRNRCEALYLDPTLGAIHCLNGRTTSTDPAWYWVSTRRVYDMIRTDIFFNFQWTKSEPNNSALDGKIQAGIDAYLENKKNQSVINGYNPTVSDGSNNSAASRSAGQRFVDLFIEPVYPNDDTQFNINRVLTASIRLS